MPRGEPPGVALFPVTHAGFRPDLTNSPESGTPLGVAPRPWPNCGLTPHPLVVSSDPDTRVTTRRPLAAAVRRPNWQTVADRGRFFGPLPGWPGSARHPGPRRNCFVGKGLQTRPPRRAPSCCDGPDAPPPDRPPADHDINRYLPKPSAVSPGAAPLAAFGRFVAGLGHFWPRAAPRSATKPR
jgi:hypothetical protein